MLCLQHGGRDDLAIAVLACVVEGTTFLSLRWIYSRLCQLTLGGIQRKAEEVRSVVRVRLWFRRSKERILSK